MKNVIPAYSIFPIGDNAITIDFGNRIDRQLNVYVISLYEDLTRNPLPGMIEAVPAYSSVSIYFDILKTRKLAPEGRAAFQFLSTELENRLQAAPLVASENTSRIVTIPVCYADEFAPDIEGIASRSKLTINELIEIHCQREYRVYMLGFLPGFSYMGEVDERIAVGRKTQPEPVTQGSVGIAGRQTGIYPFASPGGWHIIGRTYVPLFDPKLSDPAYLKPGDTVRFTPISKDEFKSN